MLQLTNNSIQEGIIKLMHGKEQFTDTTTNKESNLNWCYVSTFINYLYNKDCILVIDKLTYTETL